MTLPKWNSEWEKPDPLRGRRGWALQHYATAGVSVLLAVIVLSWAVLAFARAHRHAQELKRQHEERGDPFKLGDAELLLPP